MAELRASYNHSTRRAHRREILWQVLLPIIVGLVLAAGLVYLLVASGPGQVERGAQIAAILMTVPLVLLGLGLAIGLLWLNSSLNKLVRWVPARSYRLQQIAEGLNKGARRVSHLLEQPFLTVESWGASINKLIKRRG